MNIQHLYSLFLKSKSVSTDSRNITPSTMFFALKGSNFDGNDFVRQAVESGAYCAITDQKSMEDKTKNIFFVNNCLKALQELAQYHRIQMNIPVIGLTGSNGKTTTKELISAVLSKKYKLIATKGNLNNHIGVPLTLLTIKTVHELAIIEMGANHQKEIEFLCNIAQPDFGYITNFGKAHLEGFGGTEGVIKGKSELYHFLAENEKTAFVNCKDEKQMELTAEMERISFGDCDDTDFHFEFAQRSEGLCPEISYKNHTVKSELVGNYNGSNVAAAMAIGLYFKVPVDKIKNAIEEYKSGDNRSQIIQRENYQIILDAYNANPSSMEAALKNFELLPGNHKAVILGDMFELGETSQTEHQNIANLVSEMNIDEIFLIGEHFNQIQNSNPKIHLFSDRQKAEDYFKIRSFDFKHLLIKGSRGMALESFLNIF